MGGDINASDLSAAMDAMAANFADASLAGAMERGVEIVREGFGANFEAAQDSRLGSWPPRKDDKSHPLLRETGALFGATQGGAGGVAQIEPRELTVGVDSSVRQGGIPGAAVHNFGGGAIPQREFLHANEPTLDRVADAVADEAMKAIFLK